MKVLGERIRAVRKEQKLSQTALAEGICTQATVSKIENKNSCESLDIFYSLCSKLGVSVKDYLMENEEQELERALAKAEQLCNVFQHKKAYKVLEECNSIDIDNLTDSLVVKYFYYKGRTSSNGMRNYEQGIYYLNQARNFFKELNIYTILSINAIAVTYMVSGEGLEKAQPYFKEAYQMLQGFPEHQHNQDSYMLYFNLAKYFSELREYQKSIELCDAGIKLCKKTSSTVCLELLLYEKAYNEYFLNGTIDGYRMAYYFTKFIGNSSMLECIKKDLKQYNIELQKKTL